METFPSSIDKLSFTQINKEDFKKRQYLLNSFPTHSIHLLIPGLRNHSETIRDILQSQQNTYFIVKEVSVSSLIETTFIENFIKNGTLLVTTLNANAEVDNFISIIPFGKLVISLEAEIAKCLSLIKEKPNGKKKSRNQSHSVFKVDLNSSNFVPEKKLYKSFLCELNKINYMKFDILLLWKPNGNICPQSIISYWKQYDSECIPCEPHYVQRSNLSVTSPKLNFNDFEVSIAEDILEWAGSQICGITYSKEDGSYANNFVCPEPNEIISSLNTLSFEGFYFSDDILKLFEETKKIFEMDPSLPFIVMMLSGYQNCYILCNGFEKFSSSDKIICFVVFPDQKYWLASLNIK